MCFVHQSSEIPNFFCKYGNTTSGLAVWREQSLARASAHASTLQGELSTARLYCFRGAETFRNNMHYVNHRVFDEDMKVQSKTTNKYHIFWRIYRIFGCGFRLSVGAGNTTIFFDQRISLKGWCTSSLWFKLVLKANFCFGKNGSPRPTEASDCPLTYWKSRPGHVPSYTTACILAG